MIHPVDVPDAEPDALRAAYRGAEWDRLEGAAERARGLLGGGTYWQLNSTHYGGGVSELLSHLVPQARAVGIDMRWIVMEAPTAFFAVTKKLHRLLHGSDPTLSDAEKEIYRHYFEGRKQDLEAVGIKRGDVLLVNDPQPGGLIPLARELGIRVIWRSHIGTDRPNKLARAAWEFLLPYLQPAQRFIFTRQAHVWDVLPSDRIQVIPPSIDPTSPKNRDMARAEQARIVQDLGLDFPEPMVIQVSRWDVLKDPLGVLDGFVGHVAPVTEAHLVLAGPAPESVSDDPEAAELLERVHARHDALPPGMRARVHLARLPMQDVQRNALMVNALQRRASVVVQKSLEEGFGLTVAEAMWKRKAVVASRVGGIQDQIEDDLSGVLLDDPHDLADFGRAVTGLIRDPKRAARLGEAAVARVRERFLPPRHLERLVEAIEGLTR